MNAIDKLAAADASMTPGPWFVMGCHSGFPDLRDVQTIPARLKGYPACSPIKEAEGIALLRNALPEIVAVLQLMTELHVERNGYCEHCGGTWPCSEALALAALDAKVE